MATRSSSSDKVATVGRYFRAVILVFLVVGVVFIQQHSEHKLRNYLALVTLGSALGILRTFWIRHMWRRDGIDPDADEIARAKEAVKVERRRSRACD